MHTDLLWSYVGWMLLMGEVPLYLKENRATAGGFQVSWCVFIVTILAMEKGGYLHRADVCIYCNHPGNGEGGLSTPRPRPRPATRRGLCRGTLLRRERPYPCACMLPRARGGSSVPPTFQPTSSRSRTFCKGGFDAIGGSRLSPKGVYGLKVLNAMEAFRRRPPRSWHAAWPGRRRTYCRIHTRVTHRFAGVRTESWMGMPQDPVLTAGDSHRPSAPPANIAERHTNHLSLPGNTRDH